MFSTVAFVPCPLDDEHLSDCQVDYVDCAHCLSEAIGSGSAIASLRLTPYNKKGSLRDSRLYSIITLPYDNLRIGP